MRAHVVGNGPSWVEFAKLDPSDFAIGCNVPKANVDVTFLADMSFTHLILSGELQLTIPVVINDKIENELIRLNLQDKLNIYSVHKRPTDMNKGIWNSGHFSAKWLIEQGYNEIHLWGVDSLFVDHNYSFTDYLRDNPTKRDPKTVVSVVKDWREHWDILIKSNPSVNIVIHKPIGDYSDQAHPRKDPYLVQQEVQKKVYLFNDTSDYHSGCKAVIESYGNDIDVKVKTLDNRDVLHFDYKNVKKVILNGEGTMHHNAMTAQRFLMGLRMAQQAGCETEIHNTVWQEMSHDFDDVLKKCKVITVREVLSQQELILHGVPSKIVPDRSMLIDVPYKKYTHVNIYEGQCNLSYRGEPKGYVSKYPRINIFKQPWDEIVNRLRHCDLLITSRHHEMYAAIKARCRYLAGEGNTWKNQGIAKTVGANLPKTIDDALSGLYDDEYRKVFDYCASAKNML